MFNQQPYVHIEQLLQTAAQALLGKGILDEAVKELFASIMQSSRDRELGTRSCSGTFHLFPRGSSCATNLGLPLRLGSLGDTQVTARHKEEQKA